MTPAGIAELVTDEALGCVRQHPGFRFAVESAAAESVAHFQSQTADYQWITKDIGRFAISLAALSLHLIGGLTVHSLTAACVGGGVSSAGRVQQVVRRCQGIGEMTVEAGSGLWTRRPMRLGANLVGSLRERVLIDFRAMLGLAPELGGAAEIVETPEGFVEYVMAVSIAATQRGDVVVFDNSPPITFFLEREAGMLILFDLIGAQAPGRERLLEAARLSRYALSRRYGVSRAHINKLLAESNDVDCVQRDRVVFNPRLSQAIERYFAAVFQLNRCAAEALLSGWRFGREPAAGYGVGLASAEGRKSRPAFDIS
jgi:hypothetical protein